MNTTTHIRAGAIAGVASSLLFTLLHQLLISDIWFSLPMMAIAGAACGIAVAWSYARLFPRPTITTWLTYNAIYLVMFVLLGIASLLAFEPTTTIAALIDANQAPGELIARAMPMTLLFTVATAALLSLLYGRSWPHFGALLACCTTLILLLGLNVSIIGLVEIPLGSAYLVLELFALIAALDLAYVAVFLALQRQQFSHRPPGGIPTPIER